MTWEPTEYAWNAFLKFEQRQGQLDRCREILERFIDANPVAASYVKAANFEEHQRNHSNARLNYERALAELGKRAFSEQFFIQFTKFEIRQREYDRAKILFEYALENIPKDQCKQLTEQFITFQKQFGTRDEIEDVVLTSRRH